MKKDIKELKIRLERIKKGIDNVNTIYDDGKTALMLAAKYDSKSVYILLQYPGIDVNIQCECEGGEDDEYDEYCEDDEGKTALMFAAQYNPESVYALLQYPSIDVNIQDVYGDTALMISIDYNLESSIILIHHPDIDVNLKNIYDDTPLIMSLIRGRFELTDILLKRPDIDINEKNDSGITALMVARQETKKLLQYPGIDVNIQDKRGRTALMKIINNESILWLLEYPGIEINAQDNNGFTALMIAVKEYYSKEFAIRLLMSGAKISKRQRSLLTNKENELIDEILEELIINFFSKNIKKYTNEFDENLKYLRKEYPKISYDDFVTMVINGRADNYKNSRKNKNI